MSTLFINTRAPYGSAAGQESLDMALACANFGQDVSILFLGDGVFQLKADQQPEKIEHKNYSKTFAALEFYDIENIYVCQNSLDERLLTTAELCVPVKSVSKDEMSEIYKVSQHLVTF